MTLDDLRKLDTSIIRSIVSSLRHEIKLSLFFESAQRCYDDKMQTIIEALLDSGLNVMAQDIEGNTALHFAANAEIIPTINFLLKSGARIDILNRDGLTALHSCVSLSKETSVKAFIDFGVYLDGRDSEGNTALMLAAISGQASVVTLLLSSGANIHIKNIYSCAVYELDMLEDIRRTIQEIRESEDELVKLVQISTSAILNASFDRYLSLGRKFDSPLNEFSHSIFHLLYISQKYDVLSDFLVKTSEYYLGISSGAAGGSAAGGSAGPSTSSTIVTVFKNPAIAIYFASVIGSAEIIDLLVRAGVDVKAAMDDEGHTALHFAASFGHIKVIEDLVRAGAHLEQRYSLATKGFTPLHVAAWKGQEAAASTLIRLGASLETRDAHGDTAWQIAMNNGHFPLDSLLCIKDIRLMAPMVFGITVITEVEEGSSPAFQRTLKTLELNAFEDSADLPAASPLGGDLLCMGSS